MALPGKLGFGMMRLPVIGDDPTNFDYDQIYQMVDALHNIQTFLYDGVDGKGGIVSSMHLFDHAKK